MAIKENQDTQNNDKFSEEQIDKKLLSEISDYDGIRSGAYNIRKNGQGVEILI